MLARAHVLGRGQDYTARAIVAPEDVSAGARMHGYFTARASAQVWCSATRNLQVGSVGCAGIHDRDKSQVLRRISVRAPSTTSLTTGAPAP